jgi:hypothetical protein
MASFGLQPLVAIGVGWIGDRFGPSQALLINGLCLIGGGLMMTGRRGLLGWQVGLAAHEEDATPSGVAPLRPGERLRAF